MGIKKKLQQLAEAGLKASQPMATAIVDPLFAHTVAIEALAEIAYLRKRERDLVRAGIDAVDGMQQMRERFGKLPPAGA